MNKNIKIIKNSVVIFSLLIYFYMMLIGRNQYIYNMDYLKCILFMTLLCLVIYTYGIKRNEEKIFEINIMIYIILFLLLLFTFTFFIGRNGINFYSSWYIGQSIPFYTIKSQLKYGSYLSILKNIVGNCVMLFPLSFLLMVKNKKYNNVLWQTIIVFPLIILIEVLQGVTHTGVFDIDDIILNFLGVIVFTFLMTRFNIINKIRTLFYTDFKLSDKSKNIMFYISLGLMIIFDVIIFI